MRSLTACWIAPYLYLSGIYIYCGTIFRNLFLIGGWLLSVVVLVSAVWNHESPVSIHMSLCPESLSLPNPHPSGCPRVPGRAPSAVRLLPVRYLFYTWWCIYVNVSLNSSRPLLPLRSTSPFSSSASLILADIFTPPLHKPIYSPTHWLF